MDLLIRYAMSFLGLPYRWGGENPLTGFDCSGLVQEILMSVGIDPQGDQSAQGLHDWFAPRSTHGAYSAGALAFYGPSLNQITHVAFMVDAYRVIEAGGGGSSTKTLTDATAQNAVVRMRPVKHRKDFLVTLKPNYSVIGLI